MLFVQNLYHILEHDGMKVMLILKVKSKGKGIAGIRLRETRESSINPILVMFYPMS
jgi:hypothetical protein